MRKLALFLAGPVAAGVAIAPANAAAASPDQRLIAAQATLIARQQAQLEDFAHRLESVEATLADRSSAPVVAPPVQASVVPSPAVTSAGVPVPLSSPVIATGSPAVPKGFIGIPGTAASIKIGGRVQLDALYFPNAGAGESEDLVIPRTINADGLHRDRTRLSPRDSRVTADFRLPTAFGQVRAYTEWDFMGPIPANAQSQVNGYEPRLRQIFVEVGPGAGGWSVLAGQAWSTFGHLTSFANIYNGLPFGSVFVRQPQLRFTKWLGQENSLSIAIENPDGDVGGATGSDANTQFDARPDLVVNARTDRKWGSLQAGFLLRQIEETAPTTGKRTAWGANLSGNAFVPGMGKDIVRAQVNYGNGIGRYIGELGPNFDGLVRTAGGFALLDVLAGNVSYEHYWAKHWSSSLAVSQINIDNPDFALSSQLTRTRTVTLTGVYSPIPGLEFALEYTLADKKTEDGANISRPYSRFTSRFVF